MGKDNSALLVVDAQKGLLEGDPRPWRATEVLEAISAAVRKARAAGVPVIWVQHDGTREENLEPFTEGWQLHPRLPRDAHDLTLRKNTCDAFYGSGLEEALRARGVERLLLTGLATDFCIDTTLRNAVSRDFQVTVLADAHTTTDSPVLSAAQICAHQNWAWANCASKRPVRVVATADFHFSSENAS